MLEEGISVDFEVSLRSWIRYIPEESYFFFCFFFFLISVRKESK